MKSSGKIAMQEKIKKLEKDIQNLNAKLINQLKLEEQLLQANKMKALASLAGGIAHDFNNILQAILGYTQLALMSKTEKDPDYRTFVEIEEIIKKGSDLTGQFLAIGRKIRPKFIPLNLNVSIEGIQKLLHRTIPKMIHTELQLSDALHMIKADTGQIEQILINLCINARDAMSDKGRLTLKTENVPAHAISTPSDSASPAGFVCLSVCDTGCGIPAEIKDDIFEPYFTAKQNGNGTGLGLSMVNAIVKNHGGTIECRSEVGAGTEFRVFFPALTQESIQAKTSVCVKNTGPGSWGKEKILMVDDEVEILNIGKEVLQKHGYTVITAQNGEEALHLYSDKNFDSIILDVGMPGMGGINCLKEILSKNRSAKILISSGYTSSDNVEEALNLGAKAFLTKPYRINSLLETVRRVLDEY